jgi:O-methyltransferase involved in polyketide biosynthesis
MRAAARALEDDEESKVAFDPLAKFMAGEKAIGRAKKRRVKASQETGRQYKVGRIAVRTRWFDDQLEESLGMPRTFSPSNQARHIVTTLVSGADGKMHIPTQVVELGAGLSTRPWRLHLPAVLKWFDVDRQDVIDVRENLLIKHGAEVDMMSPIRRSESKNSILERQIGTLDHHSINVEFPLRCECRTSVAADVGNTDWIKALITAGFDASKPTVWIAEGLLMYLEPGRVDALLKEIASISAEGSCFLTGVVTETCIKNLSKKNGGNALMKEWKSGVPQDPAPWLKTLGWNSRLIITRREIAEALGLSPEDCAFDTTQEGASKGFFMVASVDHQ